MLIKSLNKSVVTLTISSNEFWESSTAKRYLVLGRASAMFWITLSEKNRPKRVNIKATIYYFIVKPIVRLKLHMLQATTQYALSVKCGTEKLTMLSKFT